MMRHGTSNGCFVSFLCQRTVHHRHEHPIKIAPLIVCISGEQSAPIGAMPGCNRLGWRHGLIDEVETQFFFLC